VKITRDNFVGFDCNKYEPVFKCKCNYDEIYWNYKFCPMCGESMESGIDECCAWGRDEMMVDWIARQIKKMHKAMSDANCI